MGLALGAALAAVSRWSGLTLGRWAVAGAAACGILVVGGEEYMAHLEHHRSLLDVQGRANLSPLARLAASEMTPPDLAADVQASVRQRGPWAWGFDALATIVTAAAVVAWQRRASAAASRAACGPGAPGPAGTAAGPPAGAASV